MVNPNFYESIQVPFPLVHALGLIYRLLVVPSVYQPNLGSGRVGHRISDLAPSMTIPGSPGVADE